MSSQLSNKERIETFKNKNKSKEKKEKNILMFEKYQRDLINYFEGTEDLYEQYLKLYESKGH